MCGNVRGYSNIMLKDTIVYTATDVNYIAFEYSFVTAYMDRYLSIITSCAVD